MRDEKVTRQIDYLQQLLDDEQCIWDDPQEKEETQALLTHIDRLERVAAAAEVVAKGSIKDRTDWISFSDAWDVLHNFADAARGEE